MNDRVLTEDRAMTWTTWALVAICPIHCVLGFIGVLMIWPFAIS